MQEAKKREKAMKSEHFHQKKHLCKDTKYELKGVIITEFRKDEMQNPS